LLPVDQLSNLLATDTDWENRVEAAIALGASRETAADAGLAAAAADPNEFVRATAARARRELARAGIPP
jgi:HEAT repeat protein